MTGRGGRVSRVGLRGRATAKAKNREQYFKNIEKTLWHGREMPQLPITAVADLASELFSSSCGARKLAGLHLPEAIEASCRGRISPCSLVLALLYLERLKTGGEMATEYLCDVTPSELFIVSMMVANKFLQDEGDCDEVENWYWSDLSGFDVEHINLLEKEFLAAMKWEVYVGQKEFWQRFHGLHRTVSMREGSRRGWYTYEEMCALLNLHSMTSIATTIVQVSAICLVSYTAAIVSMFGAAITSTHLQQYLQGTSPLTISQQHTSLLHDPTALTPCSLESWTSPDLPPAHLIDNVSSSISFFYNDSHGALEASASPDLVFNPWQLVAFLTTVSSHDQLIREVRHEVALLQLKELL